MREYSDDAAMSCYVVIMAVIFEYLIDLTRPLVGRLQRVFRRVLYVRQYS